MREVLVMSLREALDDYRNAEREFAEALFKDPTSEDTYILLDWVMSHADSLADAANQLLRYEDATDIR